MNPRGPRRNTLRSRAKRVTLALIGTCTLAGSPAPAQTLSGYLTPIEHPEYATIASQFRLDEARLDGHLLFGGTAYLFCGDYAGRSIDQNISSYPYFTDTLTLGSLEDMDVWDRYSTPQDEALALSQAHWFIDNFYESQFLNPVGDANTSQYAFQNVLWEIFGDGGTAAGLDFTTGNIDRSRLARGGRWEAPELWDHMNELLGAVSSSGIDASYVRENEIWAAHDGRPNYQDYLLLAMDLEDMELPPDYPGPAIPEPAAALLAALGSLASLRRHRRN
jgi:hypothetical protein